MAGGGQNLAARLSIRNVLWSWGMSSESKFAKQSQRGRSLEHMPRFLATALFAAVLLQHSAPAAPGAEKVTPADSKKLQFFESKIRPVLIKHCYECHSAKSEEIGGRLLVDSAPALLKGGDSGPAVVQGKPDESPLIEAIRYETVEMPPDGRLPASVVKDFEQWVSAGAVDPRTNDTSDAAADSSSEIDIEEGRKFWCFQPVRSPVLPKVSKTSWPADDIDAFVLAKLEGNALQPAPDADRRTLIRRLYFDLIGLPPAPEDVDRFVNNQSEDALSQLVDRLLESPEFGVHWGRHWLDVVRYADSNGADFNATFHDAWKYRDYVIAAFNNDKPFDRFVREQIAGDLLGYESIEQQAEGIIATGFLMLGSKMLSERDKAKLDLDVVDEQLIALGKGFLGMTLGCCRCHDHKFDPIPTEDYYALAGILTSTRSLEGESQQFVSTWPRRVLPAEDEHVAAVRQYESTQGELKKLVKEAQQTRSAAEKKVDQLRKNGRQLTMDDSEAKLTGAWVKSTYTRPFIGKGYIHDGQSEKGEKWAEFSFKIPRSATYDVQLAYTAVSNRDDNVPVSVKHAKAEIEVLLNEQKKPSIEGQFESVGHYPFEVDSPAVVTVSTRGTTKYVLIDAVRLVELDANGDPVVDPADPNSVALKDAQAELEAAGDEVKKLEDRLKALEKDAPPPLPRAFAVAEGKKIADCEVRIRGEHRNRGAKVERGFIQVAFTGQTPEFRETSSGRKELGEWLSSPDNPLTARVFVNRLWHYLMGRGIVASVDNFGQLGNRPTHPELLDRLARDFIDSGWSTKSMIRRLVLSRTYRMSSRHDEASWNADPENDLLWRAHRKRIPAESIRDSILAVSDQLDLGEGGSPVLGLGTLVTQNVSDQKAFEKKESLFRSAYLPIIRSEIPAILTVFDFADPDLVTGRRSVTNVPAQALLLLNSPFVMQQAEAAAERVRASLKAGPDKTSPDKRQLVGQTYELVLSRRPDESELTRAVEFLKSADRSDVAVADKSKNKKSPLSPLGQLIHTLFASVEFRMLN